jgi:hypothetical protein
MKNLEQREGFVNRNTNGLPDKTTTMKVVITDVDGEHICLCEWKPFNKSQYSEENMPADGYLGTAKVIEGRYTGIGFHAWEQNNSEFVWYAVV